MQRLLTSILALFLAILCGALHLTSETISVGSPAAAYGGAGDGGDGGGGTDDSGDGSGGDGGDGGDCGGGE